MIPPVTTGLILAVREWPSWYEGRRQLVLCVVVDVSLSVLRLEFGGHIIAGLQPEQNTDNLFCDMSMNLFYEISNLFAIGQ